MTILTWAPALMRVLYLEDEAIIALETVEVLRDLGFRTIDMAYSLPMAEAFVRAAQPDVALLDVSVGQRQTSCALGAHLADLAVPIVFATGHAQGPLPLGPRVRVVEKPFSPDELERALQAAVGSGAQ